MLQKDAKIIFISSANSSDRSTSFLYRMRDARERMLNVVNYVCQDHRDDFGLQDALLACPCYILSTPVYISIDDGVRDTSELFLEGAFSTELMGDNPELDSVGRTTLVSETALMQFDMCRVDTVDGSVALDGVLYVYIDPAYTNNVDASGTGVGAVIRMRGCESVTLLGLEHFFLRNLTGTATYQIASCAYQLIRAILLLHENISEVRVAVEGNSSQDSAVAIATLMDDLGGDIIMSFLHHSSTNMTNPKQLPMYLLGNEKGLAFEQFIYALNRSTLCAAQMLVSNTIKINFDPINYLSQSIRAIKCKVLRDGSRTYDAKHRGLSDDALVAVTMAHYLCGCGDKYKYKRLGE